MIRLDAWRLNTVSIHTLRTVCHCRPAHLGMNRALLNKDTVFSGTYSVDRMYTEIDACLCLHHSSASPYRAHALMAMDRRGTPSSFSSMVHETGFAPWHICLEIGDAPCRMMTGVNPLALDCVGRHGIEPTLGHISGEWRGCQREK